jgi:2-(1,2-epoxy-1,2-dihydrophenyl)acetyl-CoA isomerase
MNRGCGVVRLERVGSTALVTLDHPANGNALDEELLGQLHRVVVDVGADVRFRSFVLTGAGSTFCLGADLSELAATAGNEPESLGAWSHHLDLLAGTVQAIADLAIPAIAAVNGQAAGAGFALALSCDIRVVARTAAFNFAYGALGLSPDGGLVWFLTRAVGMSRARRLLLEQPILRPGRALEEGIADVLAPAEELREQAITIARAYGNAAAHATQAVKYLTRLSEQLPLNAYLAREREAFVQVLGTADARGGIQARLAGRMPVFEGERTPE